MSITGALVLFLIFIIVYMIIAEIFTVLFRLAGLTREKARFQVISMLTNSGYTTMESELITSSKIRRRLARMTMLFGYSFTVTIVSILVNVFISLSRAQLQNMWYVLIFIVLGIGGICMLLKYTGLRNTFDHFIERVGNKMMFGEGSNPLMVLDNYGEQVMAEVHMEHVPAFLKGMPLEESGLKGTYQIQLILLKRKGDMVMPITGQTIIQEEDVIVVFGDYKVIRHLFEKPVE